MTLVELIIVLAIIGMIAAIGYSSYLERVKRTQRMDGMGEQLALNDHVERHYYDNGSYDQTVSSEMVPAAVACMVSECRRLAENILDRISGLCRQKQAKT